MRWTKLRGYLALGAVCIALAGGVAFQSWALPKLQTRAGLCVSRQVNFDRVEIEATLLRGGVYLLRAVSDDLTTGNMTASIGEDGVFLVDSGHPELHRALRATLRRLGDDRIRVVVNTHWHSDHSCGNAALFARGATIIGHPTTHGRLSAVNDWTPPPAPGSRPQVVFADRLALAFNGLDVVAHHAAQAHTDGDVFVTFGEANVIAAGDLVLNGRYPQISGGGGTLDGYISAQERLLGLADAETWIAPGHGAPMRRADLAETLAVLQEARRRLAALRAQGLSEEQVVAQRPLEGLAPGWGDAANEETFVRTAYASLPAPSGPLTN